MGGESRCMPVFVPSDPSSLVLPMHHPLHTTVIVPCLSLTSGLSHLPLFLSRQFSMGKTSFHHASANQENRCFIAWSLLIWTFWWTLQRQKSLATMYCSCQNRDRERQCFAQVESKIDYVDKMLTHSQTLSHNIHTSETQTHRISNSYICWGPISTFLVHRYSWVSFPLSHAAFAPFFRPAFSLLTWK